MISLEEFVGQPLVTTRLSIAVKAARQQSRPLDHTLLFGPPGLGKTTLAQLMAKDLDKSMTQLLGPNVDKTSLIIALNRYQLIFIDEIHRLQAATEEILYPVMQSQTLDMGSGIHKPLPNTTIIGATTLPGSLTAPLRDRFGIQLELVHYSHDAIKTILNAAHSSLRYQIYDKLAAVSRGTPRIALRLLRRLEDLALVSKQPYEPSLVDQMLTLEGIDSQGLTSLDLKYLKSLAHGPRGLQALSALLGYSQDDISTMIEPYLLQQGLVERQSKGRELTQQGTTYLISSLLKEVPN